MPGRSTARYRFRGPCSEARLFERDADEGCANLGKLRTEAPSAGRGLSADRKKVIGKGNAGDGRWSRHRQTLHPQRRVMVLVIFVIQRRGGNPRVDSGNERQARGVGPRRYRRRHLALNAPVEMPGL